MFNFWRRSTSKLAKVTDHFKQKYQLYLVFCFDFLAELLIRLLLSQREIHFKNVKQCACVSYNFPTLIKFLTDFFNTFLNGVLFRFRYQVLDPD